MSREIGPIGIGVICVLLGLTHQIQAQTKNAKQYAVEMTKRHVFQIAEAKFPEINLNKVHIKTLRANPDILRPAFPSRGFSHQRMRHIIYVNPRIYKLRAPEKGVRAIIAHELAHVLYYTKKKIGFSCWGWPDSYQRAVHPGLSGKRISKRF